MGSVVAGKCSLPDPFSFSLDILFTRRTSLARAELTARCQRQAFYGRGLIDGRKWCQGGNGGRKWWQEPFYSLVDGGRTETRETGHGKREPEHSSAPVATPARFLFITQNSRDQFTVDSLKFTVRIKNTLTVNCRLSTVDLIHPFPFILLFFTILLSTEAARFAILWPGRTP